jgi:pseudouridine synthase
VVLVQPQNRWRECNSRMRWGHEQLRGLAPAGRLDIDSIGLLVLTQDGRVARQLIGEDSDIEKEYLVRVSYGPETVNVQSVFPPEKLALLNHGLSLDGQALRPAKVSWQNPEQLRFVLKEGKKRQIRRMCEQVGLFVTGPQTRAHRPGQPGPSAGGAVALSGAARALLEPSTKSSWRCCAALPGWCPVCGGAPSQDRFAGFCERLWY